MPAFFANPYPFPPLIVKRGEDGTIAVALGADGAVADVDFTVESDADWLSIAPSNGAIAPSETVAVSLLAATAALNPGVYNASLTISDDAEVLADLVLQAQLTVTPRLLDDLRLAVLDRIQDTAGKLQDLQGCLLEALRGRYSKARPVRRFANIAGDGSAFSWPLTGEIFPGWVDGFSVITGIEYPLGTRNPTMLESGDWFIVYNELRLSVITPAAGKTMRVSYTTLHAEDGSTVPDGDFDGLANLAAHLACKRLQAIYAQAMNSAIGADVADPGQKPRNYADLAKQYDDAFKAAFGLDADEQQPAASSFVEWEPPASGGLGRLTH